MTVPVPVTLPATVPLWLLASRTVVVRLASRTVVVRLASSTVVVRLASIP